MKRSRRSLPILSLVLAAVLSVTGCGDEGPEIPEFDGRWQGAISGQGVSVTLTARENNDGDISGNGSMTFGTDALSFSIEGVHSHPDVSFTMIAAGFEDTNFSGEFTDDETVHGNLQGSGFSGQVLVLRKQ